MAFELLEEIASISFAVHIPAELFCFSILPPCGSISSYGALVGSMILEIILLVIVSSIHIRISFKKKSVYLSSIGITMAR